MKRFFAIALVLLLCGVMFVGADDAKVMPAGIGRFYVAPTFGFANNYFNEDGESKSYASGAGSMQLFNLGFALEYGIIDWITAALQWAPGWNAWSDVDTVALGPDNDINANGVADLFLGAKLQFIGNQGLVENDMVRLALAPGVKIPLPGPDFEEQWNNVSDPANKDPVTPANIDKHVLGAGARLYFDYVINEKFFINLYSEFIGYPVKGDIFKSGINAYAAEGIAKGGLIGQIDLAALGGLIAAPQQAALTSLVQGTKIIDGGTVDYGYDLTFELEPAFSTSIAEATVFSAGLPFNFKLSPAKKHSIDIASDFDTVVTAFAALQPGLDDIVKKQIEDGLNGKGDPSYVFSLKPNVSIFFMGWALPTEFKVSYSAPLAGKNGDALHTITMQIKLYFKI